MSEHNSSAGAGPGLTNGRQWAALPLSGGPIEWSVSAEQGYVQGPLDLEFLRGQKLSLLLSERQQALLVQDGQLRAVYLDGAHYLEIGHGERQIPPSCQLIFLALEDSLQLRWPRTAPLRWGPHPDQTLIGSCSLGIEWPGRFFGTFLQGQAQPDPDFILRLIDQMVRGLFEEFLTVGVDSETTAGAYEFQARLTRVSPADLNDELNACGLNCTRLAVYTAAPPIEEQDRTQTPTLMPVRKP